MERISEHITYKEATYSETAKRHGLFNVPNESQVARMKLTATKVFEPLRNHFDTPIFVSSFFRSAELNIALSGGKNSQHMCGEAMDLDADKYDIIENKDIFNYIKDHLEFDQLIWEFGDVINPDWVHVSYSANNRKEILVSSSDEEGNTFYKKFN